MSSFFGRSGECALTYGQRRCASVLVLLLGVAAAPRARAERPVTLQDALQLARQNNRDIRIAHARLDEAKSGVDQAIAALIPTAAFSGSYTHNYKNETFNQVFPVSSLSAILPPALTKQFASLSEISVLQQDALAGGINVNVPILVPSAYAGLLSSQSTFDAARANYEVSETNILFSTATAFFAAAGADELLQARHHAVEVARVTHTNAESRFQAGTVNRTEVTRAELSLLNAQQAELQSIDTRDQSYRSLATILGLREPFKVAPPDPSAVPRSELSPDALAQQALHLRPEFAAYELTSKAAHDTAIADALKWLPSLFGFGNANLYNYASFTGDKYSWALGLQLTWTIYDGGLRDAVRRQANAQAVENELQLEQLHDTVRDDINNAARALVTRRVALETAHKSVALANETLDLLRAQYDAGTATQLDVLQAQDSVVSAEVQLAQARFDLALADLTLQRNAGTFPAGNNRP
jgi:outer membrane protein TolC